MLSDKNFTIVDVETTGGSPFFNRVIEIGLLRVEKGEVVEEYKTLINPEMDIPEFITNMTGITAQAVANAPTFAELADEILSKFEDSIFVAHNSQFDYGFLKEEFRRLDYSFNMPQLCTVRLSRALYPEHKHHNLTALIERYEFECANRHRAFDDAKVLWDFLQHAQTNIEPAEFHKALKQQIRVPRVLASAQAPTQEELE
ncbi:MAG TPA: 3'-5' exonuclease [Patescibacteria group bacterium]|nr:3'-5' exonuclease [Patescibacteria group bacterium]